MANEVKVTETPVVEEPKVSESELLIDNPREALEKRVITENDTIPEPETLLEDPKTPKDAVAVVDDLDPVDRIKKSVQKRIDKVVAQKKSIEQELAEAKAELERLKAAPKTQEPPKPKEVKNDERPTPEQVEAYIVKMREEGNVKEEVAAMRYLVKLEKELAIKEVEEKQTVIQSEEKAKADKQLADWTNLSRDYVAYTDDGKIDPKSDLNLSNQSGLLYKTALSLYNDKELHADFYNDPDVIQGFRRAVSDAYREIHQQGLIKTPKVEQIIPEKRTQKNALAEPAAELSEEPIQSNNSALLSDAEKVREEIRARKKIRTTR